MHMLLVRCKAILQRLPPFTLYQNETTLLATTNVWNFDKRNFAMIQIAAKAGSYIYWVEIGIGYRN